MSYISIKNKLKSKFYLHLTVINNQIIKLALFLNIKIKYMKGESVHGGTSDREMVLYGEWGWSAAHMGDEDGDCTKSSIYRVLTLFLQHPIIIVFLFLIIISSINYTF